MEENIFEGAKFGDKFLTRDGRIAIYHRFETKLNLHVLFVENLDCCLYCEDSGLHTGNHTDFPEWKEDIVSRYQEQIDEEKLDELAYRYSREEETERVFEFNILDVINAYKAGYKKCLEQHF